MICSESVLTFPQLMPCLIKDKTGRSPYWYCSYTAPDGRRLKKSTKQTDKAKAWEVCLTEIAVESAIHTGSATEKQLRKMINSALERIGERKLTDPTIKEQLDTWIENKRGSASDATLEAYEQARNLFVNFLGARALRSVRLLKKSDVIEFRKHLLKEGRTPSTVNKIRTYLTSPFEISRKEGLIDYNPFAAVDALKAKKVDKDPFTPEQVARLLRAANGTDWEGAILVSYGTGARLQDVANLRWSAVDSENGILTFQERKGDKRVVVGLHPDVEDWIARHPGRDDPEAYLFPTLANRKGGGRNGLSADFGRIMEKAGVAGRVLREREGRNGHSVRSLSFHSFRHGAASHVFNQAALKDITRRVTGHAARGAFGRYIHEDIEALKAATQLIPRLPKG